MMTAMEDDGDEEINMVPMGVSNTQETAMVASRSSNLPNWMRPGSSVAYATGNTSSQGDGTDSDTASDIGSDLGDYQDDNGNNFRDMEQQNKNDNVSKPRARRNTNNTNANNANPVNNGRNNTNNQETFVDEGVIGAPVGQGHRHGATVYDDWGLPISNPSNFREGRNLCRPWLVALNLFAIGLVVGILVHGGPSPTSGAYRYEQQKHYNWFGQEIMANPETNWDFMGEELVGPIPSRHEAENRLVGYGHHVAMNEKGDRIAIARTSGHRETPGEVYVYSWRDGSSRKHNHPPNPGKWRLEQILTAEVGEEDTKRFHSGQQHTPLAMSASGHRIAFTEGDYVFIFESTHQGFEWSQIAKVQSLDRDWEEEQEAAQEQANTETPAAVAGANAPVPKTEAPAKGGSHFGKHLAFSYDGKTLAVMGFSHQKGGYIRVFQDETEVQEGDRREIHHYFEPTPDIFLEEVGDSLALSGDGKKLAIGIATSDNLRMSGTHTGVVQVFGIGMDDEWYRIGEPIFGDRPMEGFGGTVSLSEDGMVLAGGVAYGGGPVKIFELIELDHFNKKWHWQQMGQTLQGQDPREHFGSQVRLDHDGAFLAIGAPGSPDMLEQDELIDDSMEPYLHGKAYLFGFNREARQWENRGEAVSAYEGDAFGYSVAIDGDGDRVIVGAPFRIVEDEVNVGVVQVFGI
ncbi:expressed unknown protein [Seminavis robusta]|uniref:Uncharacterized protein n=1 Tax=Seminavis robusta TaxID=568900 RepID=A0A9N8DGG6_9STRA|nr:expressed unknown protein [Seminavis robusta]|eukprot:Sro56_g032750.1 n/a (686) ;mRNA; f:55941-58175